MLPSLRNIVHLNLSQNELGDDGISLLAKSLVENKTIRSLYISNCFKSKSSKRLDCIESLNKLLESYCPLSTLDISGGQLGPLLHPFLISLWKARNLRVLDISNQALGSKGMIILGKILQINNTLEEISIDDNDIKLEGFKRFLRGKCG